MQERNLLLVRKLAPTSENEYTTAFLPGYKRTSQNELRIS
jgi:hypothetical protein